MLADRSGKAELIIKRIQFLPRRALNRHLMIAHITYGGIVKIVLRGDQIDFFPIRLQSLQLF